MNLTNEKNGSASFLSSSFLQVHNCMPSSLMPRQPGKMDATGRSAGKERFRYPAHPARFLYVLVRMVQADDEDGRMPIPGLAQYINAYFYPAKFDAEGKDTLEYLGKKYGPSSAAPRTPQ
jgi:hypothetical protein